MKKVLVSACLLGYPCRYDGQSKTYPAISTLKPLAHLLPFCPEEAGGLPTPRPPCEIRAGKVVTKAGEDHTCFFLKSAALDLKYCQEENITLALMKENSPSCGVHYRYDGHFCGNKIPASGLTTQALQKVGIRVFNENEINQLKEVL